jgi:DNA-binding NtrC family response regulator
MMGKNESDQCDSERMITVEVRRGVSQGPWIVEIGAAEQSLSRMLHAGQTLTLGSGATAELRIEDPTVSARHCVLRATAHGLEVQDQGSKNGVFVGPARVDFARLAESNASFVIGRTSVGVRALGVNEELADADPLPGAIGNSALMIRVAREVRRHASTRAPILLQGESGTGKDVVARAIHQLSRRSGTYVALNAGAFPESLADAELFGHRRGAFTGALSNRLGAFEQAHNGTLFLDEVAELAPAVQVKLLRVVEDGAVRAVGASQVTKVDARIVSATWAPLLECVADGKFRADLYHRLSTVVIELPPLRKRKSDIAQLASVLLHKRAPEVGDKALSSAALAVLVAHDWPGNVRELESVLYRAAMAAPEIDIHPHHLSIAGTAQKREVRRAAIRPEDAHALLEHHGGNVSAAARAAQVPRSTFRAWLSKAAAAD